MDGPGGRHWRGRNDAAPQVLTSSIEDLRVRRRRAARAIARGQSVADEDREAGLEWARLRVISGSADATTLAWGVPAILGGLSLFAPPVRVLLLAVMAVSIGLIVVGLVVNRRARRWWEQNRVGTRYDPECPHSDASG